MKLHQNRALVLLTMFACPSAWAACGYGVYQDVHMALGTVYVPRDAPVGSIIGRLHHAQGVAGWYSCSTNSLIDIQAMTAPAPDVTVGGFPLPAGKILQTNIPGIGVALRGVGWFPNAFDPANGSTQWPLTDPAVGPVQTVNGTGVRATLIKTGEISYTGTPLQLDQLVVQISSNDGPIMAVRVSAAVSIAGCSVPSAPGNNVPVPMGNVPQRAFKGPGTSAPAVEFNITLNSCIAGTYNPVPGGFVQGNFANIQLDAIRGSTVMDADRGILGLSPSANPDEDARGVAVQVLQNDGTTPMTLGMPVQLNRITNGTTRVPLKARYIQTGDGHAPTPGTANAYASFTVTYR